MLAWVAGLGRRKSEGKVRTKDSSVARCDAAAWLARPSVRYYAYYAARDAAGALAGSRQYFSSSASPAPKSARVSPVSGSTSSKPVPTKSAYSLLLAVLSNSTAHAS